ncbi:MAG TPA: arginine deiminase-related protein [Oligoflexus sp.]|uniref:dimethylarginine dimethylaminohydrolase family protein n=1 Tax=Oligoflexus sp. TaxID=1971216 RepID=UPI002D428A8D|nr:arginine deiminase-related protein [Oligoflexus sp.]HYX35225.1 arginine deiminase-related protein [Oligoflexus sp.]
MERCLIDRSGGNLRPADQYPEMIQGRSVFFVKPDAFDLVAAINAHMRDAKGDLHKVDRDRAQQQWKKLVDIYQQLGLKTTIMDCRIACPDMVFCANQTFPFLDASGHPAVILSNMWDETRHLEVACLAGQLEKLGVRIHSLPARQDQTLFEGMGDALWVPGRRLICGGYGFRTDRRIYETIHAITGTPIVLFELLNPRFYHLDTCLSLLDARTVLACREGFTDEGWTTLGRLFPRIIEVPLHEADAPGFACNAHCPDQQHVILQKGCEETCSVLRSYGFTPIEVETEEYIKSGGSVFCMKMQSPWNNWPQEALA